MADTISPDSPTCLFVQAESTAQDNRFTILRELIIEKMVRCRVIHITLSDTQTEAGAEVVKALSGVSADTLIVVRQGMSPEVTEDILKSTRIKAVHVIEEGELDASAVRRFLNDAKSA